MVVNEDGLSRKTQRQVTIRDLATHTSGIAYSLQPINSYKRFTPRRLSPYFFIDNFEALEVNGNTVVSSENLFQIFVLFLLLLLKFPMHQPRKIYLFNGICSFGLRN